MIADLWGQALAIMIAWPPITPNDLEIWMSLGAPVARTVRSWFTRGC